MKRLEIQFFALTLMVWLLAAGRAEAVVSPAEMRDYTAAAKLLDVQQWAQAEDMATKFVAKYPNSEYFPNAVLIEAQAQFKQKKCTAMVELLTGQQVRAGTLGDKFTYWLAEGYYCGSDFHAAAETFARLSRDYPASPMRLNAVYREAEARSQLKEWTQVVEALGKPDGTFQQLARTNLEDEWSLRGFLLLSEAQMKNNDNAGAEATLRGIPLVKSFPELECQRLYLLCNAQLISGHKEEAQKTSLLLMAAAQGKPVWRAKSMDLQGRIFEEMDQIPQAIKTYDDMSRDGDLPADEQRLAFLRVVELDLRLNKTDEAELRLNEFSAKHPDIGKYGLESLTLGELRLKKYFQTRDVTPVVGNNSNYLAMAKLAFQGVVNNTNSEYVGKAQLNLGWVFWEEKKNPESMAAFSAALQRLPFSTDQAVARFKVGDVLYEQKDFARAAENYNAVISQYGTLTPVKNELYERALYQLVRAGLVQTNLDTATKAMARILELFPNGLMAQPSLLLVGQGMSAQGNAVEARKVFSEFGSRFPQSDLLPEVKLAIARTYEAEKDWAQAMREYDVWVQVYTNSAAFPRAEFARAWANYASGQETNAFNLFSNLVARFPADELALKAQYWIGDFYWRQGDFVSAESKYQEVYKNKSWPASGLQFEARMMAGRAAMQRENYGEAIGYFTNLFLLPDCPQELRLQASFAAGDARMGSAASATTTNMAAYTEAIDSYYKPIVDKYPTDRIAPLAWGQIGNCYRLQMAADPKLATNACEAYLQVINSPVAGISARSMAECGLAMTMEAIARSKVVGMQLEDFMNAASHYLKVALGNNLRDNEQPDPYWVKQAGLSAGKLDEFLGDWDKARALYEHLSKKSPTWKSYWDKRLEAANNAQRETTQREKENLSKAPGGGN